jgi:hypothetical protein
MFSCNFGLFSSTLGDYLSPNVAKLECLSCVSPKVSAWHFVHLVILSFHLALDVFCFVLCIRLGLPRPLTLRLIHYICDQPLNLVGTHLLCCSHGGEWIISHNVIQDVFTSIVKDTWFHVSKPMFFYYSLFNFFPNGLISCNSWWHSHFNQCCHCGSHLSRFGFNHYFISQHGSGKGRALTQLTFDECVFKTQLWFI